MGERQGLEWRFVMLEIQQGTQPLYASSYWNRILQGVDRMRSKFTVIWILLYFLAQACAPLNKAVHPVASQVPTLPAATETVKTDASAPIVETTLPQVIQPTAGVEVTPIVSTAVAVSSTMSLPLPLITETPRTSGNILPEGGITQQERGKTFRMKAGDSFLLNLGTDIFDWTASIDNENVLRMKMGAMVIQGAQGIYDALAPGTATL
jgi:hypothetical protein